MWQPGMTIEVIEKEVILQALKFYRGNKSMTARSLDISVRTLHNKLERYGMPQEPLPEETEATVPPSEDHAPKRKRR